MAKVLIFGSRGQTGHYLSRLWNDEGHEVVACSRSTDTPVDIGRFAEVESVVAQHRPDYVFHLAAHSTTRHEALFDNNNAISTGTLNVLEAVYRHVPQARTFITGTGLQFANRGKGISERDPFEASSIYAATRIASIYTARYYRDVLKLSVYVGYLFHHESPLRPSRHVSQKIVEGVVAISRGETTELALGDLSVKKEWCFAGDVAAAITTLVRQADISEAVIGSGKPYSIEEWVTACFSLLQLSWKQYVIQTAGYRSEYPLLYSDPATIHSLGWKPAVDFTTLARMMITSSLANASKK
jgi:GDPmannose 4,6-dehydratase